MSAAWIAWGCALTLAVQDTPADARVQDAPVLEAEAARVRRSLRAWFAAQQDVLRNSDEEATGILRAAALRAWPRGQIGESWLAHVERQRALFADTFHYAPTPVEVPELRGMRVHVPANYDPAHPVPAIVHVRSQRQSAVRVGPMPVLSGALIVSVTPLDLQALMRPADANRAFVVAASRLAMTPLTAALAGKLWALHEGEVDDELVQRGLFALLGILQRHYHLDRERVLVDAMRTACRPILRAATQAPDRFAGIVLRAPQGEHDIAVDNLSGVHVLVLRSGGGSAVTALERAFTAVPDGRCEVRNADEVNAEELGAWCAERRRHLLRPHVRLLMPAFGVVDGFWVTDISAGGDPMEGPARIDVVADRAAARIKVTTWRIEHFSLLLNDALIDLDHGFVLDVNGAEIALRRARSAAFLCDGVLRRFDPGFLFTTAISIDVPRTRKG